MDPMGFEDVSPLKKWWENPSSQPSEATNHQTFHVPKMEESSQKKMYGYGLCKGKPTSKLALLYIRFSTFIFDTWNFLMNQEFVDDQKSLENGHPMLNKQSS